MTSEKYIDSTEASEMLANQLQTWPLAQKNYKNLEAVKIKSIDMGGFTVDVQFNPTRILSTAATLNNPPSTEKKCFLCPWNLPPEQIHLPFGTQYNVLCNPYPIFKEHFTIPSTQHERQEIRTRLPDLLTMACQLNKHTLFYNGPASGASIPDHAHFQAVSTMQMPIEKEIDKHLHTYGIEIYRNETDILRAFTHYLRNGIVIESSSPHALITHFNTLYDELKEENPQTGEPGMNIFCRYRQNKWQLIIIPRLKHRPWQFNAKGEDHFLSSPGAADMGGLFITPRKEDFEKANPEIIRNIYQQVCYSDKKIKDISQRIKMKYKINNNL